MNEIYLLILSNFLMIRKVSTLTDTKDRNPACKKETPTNKSHNISWCYSITQENYTDNNNTNLNCQNSKRKKKLNCSN
jgi:hypothetical protein